MLHLAKTNYISYVNHQSCTLIKCISRCMYVYREMKRNGSTLTWHNIQFICHPYKFISSSTTWHSFPSEVTCTSTPSWYEFFYPHSSLAIGAFKPGGKYIYPKMDKSEAFIIVINVLTPHWHWFCSLSQHPRCPVTGTYTHITSMINSNKDWTMTLITQSTDYPFSESHQSNLLIVFIGLLAEIHGELKANIPFISP